MAHSCPSTLKYSGIVLISIFLMLAVSKRAEAFPVIDAQKVHKWIFETGKEITKYKDMVGSILKRYNLIGKAADAIIQTKDNNAVNIITRLTANQNSIFNKKLSMAMQPAFGTCQTFNISQVTGTYACKTLDYFKKSLTSRARSELSNASQVDRADSALAAEQEGSQPDPSIYTNAANYENVDINGTSDKAGQYTDLFLSRITPSPDVKFDERDKDTDYGNRIKVRALTTLARANFPAALAEDAISKNQHVADSLSQQQIDERFGENFSLKPKDIIKQNRGDQNSPQSVMRKQAVARAYRSKMLLGEYQAALKKEVAYANLILERLKQPSGRT